MTTSVGTEKPFDKIEHPLMIKAYRRKQVRPVV